MAFSLIERQCVALQLKWPDNSIECKLTVKFYHIIRILFFVFLAQSMQLVCCFCLVNVTFDYFSMYTSVVPLEIRISRDRSIRMTFRKTSIYPYFDQFKVNLERYLSNKQLLKVSLLKMDQNCLTACKKNAISSVRDGLQ